VTGPVIGPVIGLVAVTAAGRLAAERLADAWGDEVRRYDGRPGSALPAAFAECEAVVAFLATGAAVRLLAPHLGAKGADPGVVCVDEACRYAVALLGGHAGGGNDLARRVSAVLGCQAVITTATDAVGLPGLDALGWPVEGDVAGVSRAILDGEPVRFLSDAAWPLPAFPPHVSPDADAAYAIVVSDRSVVPAPATVVLRPPSLVVGVGASRGVTEQEVLELITAALAEGALSPASVRCLATADIKADEPGIVSAANRLGVPLTVHSTQALAEVETPNPSEIVRAAVGVPSVAEAAALTGGTAELVVPKRAAPRTTVAVARHRPRGRLALVGLGPGARDLLTPRAADELRRASVVVGLDRYVEQVHDLLRPGTRILATGLGSERQRAASAVDQARLGHAVALVGSGDPGVYALASPALEQAGRDIDVVGVPGVTAALAAAALLGAPLGHDHAAISLSDLHTPWEAIERRVRAAADGDFVVCFYNPRSGGRDWQLPMALAILGERRSPATPVGLVRDASRADEKVTITRLAEVDAEAVDMHTVVVVGSSNTRVVAGRMVTPRGYRWRT
jgi:cobalt-precorrin 5A hydrolase / precorrin-3B C17-methyltransferase